VGLLVVLACLSFLAAVPGLWAKRNFLDTDRFVSRVAPLVDEPAVQDAVSARLTHELMEVIDPKQLFQQVLPERGQILAVPLANAVVGFVRGRVDTFVQSDRFARLWESSVRVAHETATKVLRGESDVATAANGQVTLNLVPVVDAVLKQITSASPEILGRQVNLPDVSVNDIPKTAIARVETALGVNLGDSFGQVTVYDDGKLQAAQDGVRLFDRFVVLMLPLAAGFAALALWLSRRRRRTLLQLAAGVVLGMVLIRRVAFRFDGDVADLLPTAQGRRAAVVVVDTFVSPLTTFAAWAIGVAVTIAVVALITGPYPWAVSLRRRVGSVWASVTSTTSERARDEATVAWIREHRDLLFAGGALVVLVALLMSEISWGALLVVIGLVVAFETIVYRIAARPSIEPSFSQELSGRASQEVSGRA
jgi:hypothetical protein